jgi:hypothetical protein
MNINEEKWLNLTKNNICSREHFNESWLVEMPQRVAGGNYLPEIIFNMRHFLSTYPIQSLSSGLKKLEAGRTWFYWIEENNEIVLAMECYQTYQNLSVGAVGKKYKGVSPYADEFYLNILKDITPYSLVFNSDETLSNNGFDIWKRLLVSGHKISVYNKSSPNDLNLISSEEELEKYFNNEFKFRDYIYVLSESVKTQILTKGFFNTRRMRELAGIL